ncbi:MAG: phosphoenolpyruvate carboxylase [Saprospiraceae bacterium]|nr:phosphoenolpyruvate carboxylase [Saprospiraceae bacterium]
MKNSKKIKTYKELVENKYRVYNSLFMNLPYERVANIGMLIPLLHKSCKEGLRMGKNPVQIIDQFFDDHTNLTTQEEKIDFFFRVVQYVERQVVLFDSIEDARLISLSQQLEEKHLTQFVGKLNNNDISAIQEKLNTFSTRIVFTAHPTQFYPLTVLDIINNLRHQILNNELTEIDISLQQLGMTSFINEDKPTPLDEAKNIIYYLRYVYYNAVGEIFQQIKDSLYDGMEFTNYDVIKLGFWPGGDRDGNPFVTADTTQKVADELRTTLYKCYYNELKSLGSKLTFKKVRPLYTNLSKRLYQCMFDPSEFIESKEIIDQLTEILEIIDRHYNGLFHLEVETLIDKVNIFKTHFAALDIRQDSSIHRKVVTAILDKYQLSTYTSEDIPLEELVRIIQSPGVIIQPEDFSEGIISETILNVTNLKNIQAKNGIDGCHRYIISNSEHINDILFVYLLFKLCGYQDEEIHFDIVPLFETMVGMNNSKEVMETLFNLPLYNNHLNKRDNKQSIMLGFSDGTKDGGYLRANWNIHQTKERLSGVCNSHDIKAVFFDGRGGPPARGGGKTHSFYASQSKKIANNEIQLTIQGQTITSTYGTPEAFIYNVEQMVTAGLEHHLKEANLESVSKSQYQLMDELSSLSFEKYDALKNHPMFIPYLEEMSTLKYYSNANIGSRPGKRGNKAQLTLSDLRAISFVGSWSQLKQNVPGYFGIGTALETLKKEGRIEEAKKLFQEMPFFKALIMNSMMSLSKSYFPLTAYMQNSVEFGEFWNILHDEYKLSLKMVLEISGYDQLMEEEPISHTSIGIREKIVLPLLTIQQYALQTISSGSEYQHLFEKIVTRSLYGNINASRNSA